GYGEIKTGEICFPVQGYRVVRDKFMVSESRTYSVVVTGSTKRVHFFARKKAAHPASGHSRDRSGSNNVYAVRSKRPHRRHRPKPALRVAAPIVFMIPKQRGIPLVAPVVGDHADDGAGDCTGLAGEWVRRVSF